MKYRKCLRQLCMYKGIEIVEANACIDHSHILVRNLTKLSVSSSMGCLKEKSSLMIFDELANLKYNKEIYKRTRDRRHDKK